MKLTGDNILVTTINGGYLLNNECCQIIRIKSDGVVFYVSSLEIGDIKVDTACCKQQVYARLSGEIEIEEGGFLAIVDDKVVPVYQGAKISNFKPIPFKILVRPKYLGELSKIILYMGEGIEREFYVEAIEIIGEEKLIASKETNEYSVEGYLVLLSDMAEKTEEYGINTTYFKKVKIIKRL